MGFDLLAEVKRLEKQLHDVLAGMAIAAKGKALPPQAQRLCGLGQTLAEIRADVEKGDGPLAAPPPLKASRNEAPWGTAFKAPPPAAPVVEGLGDVAEAWVYGEDGSRRAPDRSSAKVARPDPTSDSSPANAKTSGPKPADHPSDPVEPPTSPSRADQYSPHEPRPALPAPKADDDGWEDFDNLDES